MNNNAGDSNINQIKRQCLIKYSLKSVRKHLKKIIKTLSWEKATTVKFDTINFINPGLDYKSGYHQGQIEKRLSDGKLKDSESETSNYAAYFSDVISLDDRWFLMASLRLDHFDNKGKIDHIKDKIDNKYSQTALSPKFGLVY